MIYNDTEILQQCDYYIGYEYTTKQQAKVHINLGRDIKHSIKFDINHNKIHTTWNGGISYDSNEYSAPCIANLILREICKENDYPYSMVVMSLEKNKTNSFFFDVPTDSTDQAISLFTLSEDIYNNGLFKHHIELAKEKGVLEGLVYILNFIYELDIDVTSYN